MTPYLISSTSAISNTHNLLSLYFSSNLIIRCLVGCRRIASCCAWISAWALDSAIVKLLSGSPLRVKLSSTRFLLFGREVPQVIKYQCGIPATIEASALYLDRQISEQSACFLTYAFGCTRDEPALQCLHTCDALQAGRTYRGVRLHPCQRHSLDERSEERRVGKEC